ncbi:MAG: potassium transporter [Thermodesulfobacteriota bacterium]
MKRIWIIGGGRFGALALKRLSGIMTGARFTIVDPAGDGLESMGGSGPELIAMDGVGFLTEHLHPESGPDWIIPALPIHLAAEWCLARLGPERAQRIEIPSEILSVLPNPMRGEGGDAYVSHANFICPDDCPEPTQICTATGEPRKPNLFDVLRDTPFPEFHSRVIRSRQLGPGVGGYRPRQLFHLLNLLEKAKGNHLVSTACRCHGVLTGIARP